MDYDIVIVGAGPAGLSFASSLASTGLRIAIVEKQSLESIAEPVFDGRDIALTHLSVQILKELGVWTRLADDDITPILEAKVLDGQSPYSLNFDRKNDSIEALGYLVSNHHIRKAVYEVARRIDNLDIVAHTSVTSVSSNIDGVSVVTGDGRNLEASLVVAADSRFSETRRMMGISASMFDFGRVCVVCRMDHDLPHNNIARECFHYGRTLAVLPLNGNQSSIVITAPMSDRDKIMNMTEDDFNQDVQRRFGGLYGEMRLASERFAYPLVGVHARKFYATRFALIGDAAVGMHPVTAHGFNLGLSGQQILAKEVINAVNNGSDIGAHELLQRFESRHMRTTLPMYHGTNNLVKFFTDDRAPVKVARKIALRLANNFPPIKHAIRHKLTDSKEHPSLKRLLLP
ncbi:MAG TPA: 5-demethoxyubiquinol-8 5-hydroxylase UbiM [Gammaproteobacteria bacterium]|nr:5-demethoxyubiquinol-8 5-hydroxylase UbiM [Gammaproteobacteria bacterium]HIL94366.1 FAD-dependent hydroxylase [Pseudomonadales bacterium]